MSEPIQAVARLQSDEVVHSSALLTQSKTITISSDTDYEVAAAFITDIQATEKRLDADRVKLKAPFLAGTRQIDDYFREPIQRCRDAIQAVKGVMIAYDDRKRREREERERQAEMERRRAADEARLKAEAEEEARRAAEAARLAEERQKREAAEAEARRAREAQEAAEAKARGDQEAAAAASARAAQAERDAAAAREQAKKDREAQIEARRAQLRAESEAAALREAAAKPIEAAPAPVKVAGVARKTVWKFRIKNNRQVPMAYLKPDDEKIQEAVERLRDLAQETLGDWIEVYTENLVAVGRGRGK